MLAYLEIDGDKIDLDLSYLADHAEKLVWDEEHNKFVTHNQYYGIPDNKYSDYKEFKFFLRSKVREKFNNDYYFFSITKENYFLFRDCCINLLY